MSDKRVQPDTVSGGSRHDPLKAVIAEALRACCVQASNEEMERAHAPDSRVSHRAEVAARAVRESPEQACEWWIATDFLRNGGKRVMGPFPTEPLAMQVRSLLERANRPQTYAVDSERAAPGAEG